MRTTITQSQRRQIARDLLNDTDFCHQVLLNAISNININLGRSSNITARGDAVNILNNLNTLGDSLDNTDDAWDLGSSMRNR